VQVERQPGFVYNPKRVPSYCDRILWRDRPALAAGHTQRWLRPAAGVGSSDHKAVVAAHQLQLPRAGGPPAQAVQVCRRIY
jgi:hypothetical protein